MSGASSLFTPYDELVRVLDPDRASALVAHRKALHKPLIAHSAMLLARELEKCPDPNGAADAMMLNGWAGIKPEWLIQQTQRYNGQRLTRVEQMQANLARRIEDEAHQNPAFRTDLEIDERFPRLAGPDYDRRH